MKNFIFLLVYGSLFSFFIPTAQAITTTGTAAGVNETVTWSISGIPDSDIHFSSSYNTNSSIEYFYYTAPLRKSATTYVIADIFNARELISTWTTQRSLDITIPDAGTRWKAQKKCDWTYSSGTHVNTCSPDAVSIEHSARYSPYQAVPAYPVNIQADKAILIEDSTFTFEEGWRKLIIVIMPQDLIGFSNDEENGLPKHAQTEPDWKGKKPYGCNSCSPIGLPGYRVNMFNLRPVIQDPLFQWGSRGPTIQLTLTWNAGQETGHTNFGTGWRFSYDAWLEESSSGVKVQQDTGGQLHFDIPPSGNANVTSVTAGASDATVIMEYSAPLGEANYTDEWDGKFLPDPDGYALEKRLGEDPNLKRFILTPPDKRIAYVFEGPSEATGPVPLVAIEDWNGNSVQITRNGSGAITQITDAVNRTATLEYNEAGQCTLLSVPGGGGLQFSYSGTDMVQSVDLIGAQTVYTYNSSHFMTSMTTAGRPWLFNWSTFDGYDYLSSVTDPQGATTLYDILLHAAEFHRTRVIDPTGRSFTYDYPSSGRCAENTRPQSTRINADTKGRPVEIYQKGWTTYPRTLAYDDNSNITRVTDYEGGVHAYTYNDRNQVIQYVDALNNTWTFEYDSHGNRTRMQSPAGRIYQYAYNALGELTEETDPEGNIKSCAYDTFGNLQTVTDAEGSTTTYQYDTWGITLTGITDPLGNTTSFDYDANQRLTRTTHPDGTWRENYYDCCAATGLRNENGDIRTVIRTPSLKVTQESDYLGNTTTHTYDAAGRLTASCDPQGRTIHTNYNELGLASSVENPTGDVVSWTYDQGDTLLSHQLCQDPPAAVNDIDTSSFGPVAKANGWEYVRDRMGRLLSIITPRDHWKKINYSRDADGLLTGKDVDGSPVATFVRDDNGMLAASTHALGTDSYSRNGRGQVTLQTWYDDKQVTFGYDGAGRLDSLVYPDGSPALYNYDSRGRIIKITWKGQTFDTGYDPVGNIVKEIRSNGITTDIANDKNSMPVRVHHHAIGQEYLDLQGVRNAGGLITRIQKLGDVLTWVPQLISESTDATFTYGHSFTVVSRNGEPATTDIAGNQTSIPGSRAFTGTYNFLDLLTDWTASGTSNSAVYDGQRRLVQWTRNGEIRNFHYDETGRLLFETNHADDVTAAWLYRENQIIAMADSNGIYSYHTDLSGNVSFLSDTSGAVIARYGYLPFGLQTSSMATVNNPFTFVGAFGVIDLDDGLYYMGSRTYDAVIRAFLSNDPIGMGVTVNAREYAKNNPVNWIDPDGRQSHRYSGVSSMIRPGPDMAGGGYKPPARKQTLREMRGLPPEAAGGGIDPCVIDALWNTACSDKKYGTAAGVMKVMDDLRKGSYGDALYDAVGTGLGKANPYAGAVSSFMKANPAGLPPDKEAALIQKAKNDPNSYYNQHRKHSPSSGEFTLPPFSLDD